MITVIRNANPRETPADIVQSSQEQKFYTTPQLSALSGGESIAFDLKKGENRYHKDSGGHAATSDLLLTAKKEKEEIYSQ